MKGHEIHKVRVVNSSVPRRLRAVALAGALAFVATVTASDARNVGPLGGAGGGEFRIMCEPGDFLVGFDVMATHVIDRIAPVCGDRIRRGTYGRPWIGGVAGTLHRPRCLDGGMLTILHVFADKNLVNRLGFTCWHPGKSVHKDELPTYGGQAIRSQRQVCRDGEVGVGIFGRAGTAIDSLGLICEKLPAAPPPSPPVAGGDRPPADMVDMLNAHNEKRRSHCVPPLAWNSRLASAAQQYADLCKIGVHGSTGENLADFASWITANNKETPVLPARSNPAAFQEAWYCEIKQYNFDAPVFVGGFTQNCAAPVNGHFTQVVWKDTRELGCGKATCTINGKQGTHWVCRYLPAGNVNAHDQNVLRQQVLRPTCR